jgi:hypothetical protein
MIKFRKQTTKQKINISRYRCPQGHNRETG